ncbi:MAG: hypothetical protein P1V81_06285 [Planctomycetota bacterium]|nr:hypothetical protein [Planctomycetota bacterium]
MQRPIPSLAVGTFVLLGSLVPSAAAQSWELEELPTRWRMTVERVEPDGHGDPFALVGVHYDLLSPFEEWPDLFVGVGGYGAVSDDIGGFFAGGLDLGWRRSLTPKMSFEAGTFTGAAGGSTLGAGGDGLFLRPFVAVTREVAGLDLRLELAHEHLAGADYDETVLAFGFELPSSYLTGRPGSGWLSPIHIDALEIERWQIESGLKFLDATGSSRRRDGSGYVDDLALGGVRLSIDRGNGWHLPFEAMGAVGGGISGFTAVMGGVGRHGELLGEELGWELDLLGGLAGGGNTDTGGGLVYEATAGLRARLSTNWSARLALGWFDAPDGRLGAEVCALSLAWDPRSVGLTSDYDRERLGTEGLPLAEGKQDTWQLSTHWKLYDLRASAHNLDGSKPAGSMQVAGVGAERHLDEHLSLLVRAAGAIEGEASGYHEGLAGLRVAMRPFGDLLDADLHATYEIGAAGGGGVDAGSGWVHQVSTGLLWRASDAIELSFDLGRMNTVDRGSFDASMLGVGVAFDVTRLISRR